MNARSSYAFLDNTGDGLHKQNLTVPAEAPIGPMPRSVPHVAGGENRFGRNKDRSGSNNGKIDGFSGQYLS